jgi:hypothetical protein
MNAVRRYRESHGHGRHSDPLYHRELPGGFYISTLLYLPAGMLYLGQRSWKVIAGVTVGLPLIVFIFFDLILGMQMPVGILFGI